jgi:RNA polymerase sigma factor (sigma-70 family)
MYTPQDIERLVDAAQRGDELAWRKLVTTFTPLARRAAGRTGLPACDVDDAVQLTWMNANRHLRALTTAAAFPGWLSAIARREALRIAQKRSREVLTETAGETSASEAPSPEQTLFTEQRAVAVRAAVNRLPARQRSVVLAFLDRPDASYETLARELAMPIGSIGPTRVRSIERLRRDGELGRTLAA